MRIFIIDDDPFFKGTLKFQLETFKKHDLHVYSSAERALGQLSLQPDIIFLDHYLEKIPGTEVIPLILKIVPSCKIISMSSQEDIKIMDQAIKNGAYMYLKKDTDFPRNVIELLSKVEEPSVEPTIIERISGLFNSTKKRVKPLVFIAEDNEALNFIMSYKLDVLGEYDIEAYSTGEEVIDNVEKVPDIIIMDYNLEKMQGSKVIEVFKEKSPDTKIIVMSSQQNIDIALKLLGIGADDYIVKGKDILERIKLSLQKNLNG